MYALKEFMRKIVFVAVCVFVFFLAEFFLFNMMGRWFMPDLLLLLVIYINLAFGIRYSLAAAVLAGILKDSFGTGLFGLSIFSFVVCAYATIPLKRYLHYTVSRRSKLLLVFFVTVIHFTVNICVRAMFFEEINALHIFKYVFVPEVVTALIAASFIFTQLRKCVLRFFA